MQKKHAERKKLSRVLIITGIALIAAAICVEASRYPWGARAGVEQDESSLPDPTPVVLRGEDADSVVEDADDALNDDSSISGQEETAELPGSEAEDAPSDVYFQLGILKIPVLNVSQNVLEGTQRQMRYGVGHVSGTVGLGEEGNCAIAGHNTTAFRYLYKLKSGDSVVLKANGNVFTYSVYDSFAVLPDETWVLNDIDGEDYSLTLITCTPYLVSSHRLIVRARLTDINGMTPNEYYDEDTSAIG
ncbi:MAG: class D sortase [Oscillospiraceae bacterium]|nr:class D sortase [Oscillospiraceae bacterium]